MLKTRQRFKKYFLNFFRGFLLFCVLLTYGGGSAAVQGLAWVTMIPTQVISTGSLEDGLKNTFNGEHACSLCALASDLRDNEEDIPSPDQPEKLKKNEAKEKTVFNIAKVKLAKVSCSQTFRFKKTPCRIKRVQLDVETPPPDFV